MSDTASKIVGYFDAYVNGFIVGWCYDEKSPFDAISVDLVVDGEVASTVVADDHRPDLASAGLGDGHHGFRIEVPKAFHDSAPHSLELRATQSGTQLEKVPGAIIFGDPIAQAATKPQAAKPSSAGGPRIALIMPTYNRAAIMERTLRAYSRCAAWKDAEVFVVDDGSRDNTSERLKALTAELPNVVALRIDNSGPGTARNIAASRARAPLLLFIGDDVEPNNPHFIDTHIEAHAALPSRFAAVLGKIVWPERSDVTFLMQHVQGEGQQQFGFKYMEPYRAYHWPFFYTSNVSVKRSLVEDWLRDGFDVNFDQYGFEDAEFAFRVSKRAQAQGKSFDITYVPAATCSHDHPHNVSSFIRRQISCGMMARHFFSKHPEVASEIGLSDINKSLQSDRSSSDLVDLYLSVFEGLKAWAKLIEGSGTLGSQNWHGDLLKAIFELSYYEGYLRAIDDSEANVPRAARWIFDRVSASLNQTAFREVLGQGFPRSLS